MSEQRVQPIVYNGLGKILVLSESILADDSSPVSVTIPTKSGKSITYSFVFLELDGHTPKGSILNSGNPNHVITEVKLGPKNGSFVALQNGIDVKIEGVDYTILYAVTRVIGRTARIEFSIYEKR